MNTTSPGQPSLGRRLLPARWHERMQIDRFHISEFLRHHALPVLKSGMRLLDAGSGHLPEQVMRAELLATGATLRTNDFSAGPGVDDVMDVSAMTYPDNSFDAIICTQVLEHVQSPPRTVAELARVLAPGGHLFISAPQSAWLHNLPWHYFNPTRFGIELLLEQNGLTVVSRKAQGGHFSLLATNLHYTVTMLQRSKLPGLVRKPAVLVSRLVFGLALKVFLLWLDRFDTDQRNTLGWCFHARKKEASGS
jgi:SAM-dependent methyltransferase